ncbi:MAG: transglutaminase domain-containing protein [Clostridia bacterium]|nr:transglutaminase domain-containing protein [Clostridia bacterium]
MLAPYEVSAESKGLRRADLSQEGLKAEGLKGKRSYELTVYQPLTKDYGSVSAKSVIGDDTPYNSLYEEAFAPTEKVYRAFVKENELAVPEEYAEYLGPLAKAVLGSPRNPNEVIRRIRAYFNTNYTYSLELPEKATGADPFLQFLSTRTGYDAHFATLAALLLREAGIPARYAEGYLVSEELAASVPKEEDVVLEVPDSASHAWVELYMEGVGWVPLEMTPGFYESKGSPKGAGTTSEETVVQPEEVPEPVDNGEDTSEEGGGGEGDTPKENDPEETAHFHWALVLLPVLLLLLLVPLLWDYRIRKRIERADSPETVAVAYRYLMRVFRFRGLKPDEHRPKAIAPLLGDGKDAYLSALELMYKESFSEEGLTPPERAQVCETVLDLTGDLKLLRHARRQVKESSKPDREAHHGK